MVVAANFFDVIGVPMSLGRGFTAAEAQAERDPAVAVVSYGFWQRRLGSDPNVLGRTLIFNGQPFTVLGVLADRARSMAGFGLGPRGLSADRPRSDARLRFDRQRLRPAVGRPPTGRAERCRGQGGDGRCGHAARVDRVLERESSARSGSSLPSVQRSSSATSRPSAPSSPCCSSSLASSWRLPAPTSPGSCWRGRPRVVARWPCAWRWAPAGPGSSSSS